MDVTKWIQENWGVSNEIQVKVLFSIMVILVLWLLRFLLLKIVFRRVTDPRDRYFWRSGVKNTSAVLLVLTIGAIWVDQFGSLATFLGLVTAGLAIALQDPLVNLAGWLFILIRRPFEIGDRIQIGDYSGDVIDIRYFQFTLNEIGNWVDADQSTGRIIHIPNGKVFKEPQANYNQSFEHIWDEMGILVTFESDWQKAKTVLRGIMDNRVEALNEEAQQKLIEASKKYMIYYRTLSPIIYTAVKDSGVMLTMRYLVDPKKRRNVSHMIWEDILNEFKKLDDVDFAYPTTRIYYNHTEGKEGTRGPS